jgi:hypothetical protein
MAISKLLNLVGLILGVIAAGFMFYFPPRIRMYTEKGQPIIQWVANPKEEKKSVGAWQVFFSKLGPGLLLFAFLLQLIGVWLSK